ncbi:MAG: tetratricopeptide repeat protein [Alphaproteobacteria bacterium]
MKTKRYNNKIPENYQRVDNNLKNSSSESNRILAKDLLGKYFFEEGNKILDIIENKKFLSSKDALELYKKAFGFFEDAQTKVSEYEDCGRYTIRGSDLCIFRENKASIRTNINYVVGKITMLNQKLERSQENIPYILKVIEIHEAYETDIYDELKKINYNNLAFAYYKNGEYDKAIETCKKSIEFIGGKPFPYPHRNIILGYLGAQCLTEAKTATDLYLEMFDEIGDVLLKELKIIKSQNDSEIVSEIYKKFKSKKKIF